jgi:uncharacterized protein YgiM (DUF1202 family)
MLIVVIGLIIIGLLAVILFVLLNNQGQDDAPVDGGGEAPPPTLELPSQLPSGPTVTALEPINVRSGPGTEYPSFGVAPAGTVAEVIGMSNDGNWWVIRLPVEIAADEQGWVSVDFVEPDNIGQPPIIEAPPVP